MDSCWMVCIDVKSQIEECPPNEVGLLFDEAQTDKSGQEQNNSDTVLHLVARHIESFVYDRLRRRCGTLSASWT